MTGRQWHRYRSRLGTLKRLARHAHQAGDIARRNELCKQHDDLVLAHERRNQLPLRVVA